MTPGLAVISTVCKYSSSAVVDSYHEYHICPHKFFYGDAVALRLSRDILKFPPLVVLTPHDSNLAVYAQFC